MSAQIWPFAPLAEMIEALEWATDVLPSRGEEQRIALRAAPRRTFNMAHLLTDYQYSAARGMVRSAQADEGFLLPDWSQRVNLGEVSPSSELVLDVDLSYIDMGDRAILWESPAQFEAVDIEYDSNGVTLETVVNHYSNARLMPLWAAESPEGLTDARSAGRVNQASISFEVSENNDLSASDYEQYRGHDVIPHCPVVADGSFQERVVWDATRFDNMQSQPAYLRSRILANETFQMRWHEFTQAGQWELRRWLHSRRGRQKVFWISSRGKDMELAAAIGSGSTTVTVFDLPGVAGLGVTAPFDIDITTRDGASYYRRVSAGAVGTPAGDRTTIDMTIDSALGVNLAVADVARISFLRCTRFNADRIELLHRAAGGMAAQVPCIEVLEP